MDADKLRNLTDPELRNQEHDLSDQLFRLKFQMKMGQTESLKKIRELRRSVARVKTIMRERQSQAQNAGRGTKAAQNAAEKK